MPNQNHNRENELNKTLRHISKIVAMLETISELYPISKPTSYHQDHRNNHHPLTRPQSRTKADRVGRRNQRSHQNQFRATTKLLNNLILIITSKSNQCAPSELLQSYHPTARKAPEHPPPGFDIRFSEPPTRREFT